MRASVNPDASFCQSGGRGYWAPFVLKTNTQYFFDYFWSSNVRTSSSHQNVWNINCKRPSLFWIQLCIILKHCLGTASNCTYSLWYATMSIMSPSDKWNGFFILKSMVLNFSFENWYDIDHLCNVFQSMNC